MGFDPDTRVAVSFNAIEQLAEAGGKMAGVPLRACAFWISIERRLGARVRPSAGPVRGP
jgi:hypothetical protein